MTYYNPRVYNYSNLKEEDKEKVKCMYVMVKELEETELPNFKKGTMYKGMQPKDEYSLDELGLFK